MVKEFKHISVLPKKTIEFLAPKEGGIYVDATLGKGGHTKLIAEKIGKAGKIIAIDQDQEAIEEGKKNLAEYKGRIFFVKDNFRNLDKILENLKIKKVDGVLFDFGVSTFQIENPERGFSFAETEENLNSKLDMRMDKFQSFSALDIINKYKEDELRDIFLRLGEEKFAGKISKKIGEARKRKQIIKVRDLLEIIKSAVPKRYIFGSQYASRIFRALRMEVNNELPAIEEALPKAFNLLKQGGRIVAISFHSLEDRIVKNFFREISSRKNDAEPSAKNITKKPITPSREEILQNKNSSSAKLRGVEKLV